MCRSIKSLFNFAPPASEDEIDAASCSTSKLSGFHHPSKENEKAFHLRDGEVAKASRRLLESLHTSAPPAGSRARGSRRPCTLGPSKRLGSDGVAAATLHEEKIEGSHSGRSRKAVLMKKIQVLCVVAVLFGAGFLSASEVPSSSERRTPLVKQDHRSSPSPLLPGTERKIEKVWYDPDHLFSETDLFFRHK